MTPIADIPTEMIAMAAGCVEGHSERIMAILLVSFEHRSLRDVSDRTGIEKTMIIRDRKRFRRACEGFGQWRYAMKTA